MSAMRIGPYKRLGPDLVTTWGRYPSPFITQPVSAVQRPWMPPTIQGRHPYRTQPRNLSMLYPDPVNQAGAARDIYNRGLTSLVPGSTIAHGVGAEDPNQETKLGMGIFLGALGLMSIGWLMFGAQPQRGRR